MLRHSLVVAVTCWAVAVPDNSWAQALVGERSHNFGTVPRGPILRHSFRLTNTTTGPIHVSSVRVSCSCVSASITPEELATGETAILFVQLDTSRVSGFTQKAIYVQLDQPQWEETAFSVQANVLADVTLTPDSLAFGRIKRGSSREASVTVQFFGTADYKTLLAKCDSPYVEVGVRQLQRDVGPVAYQVTARLRPDFPAGNWYGTIWLGTDNPTLPRLPIPLTVQIGSALSVSPKTAVLGQVKRGSEAKRTVVVCADQPFRILEVKGTDAQVLVEESVPASKAVHVLTVKLQASGPGVLHKTFQIITDLPEDNRIDFQATAEIMP